MTKRFDQFLAIDWSGAKGPRQKGIALALAKQAGVPQLLRPEGAAWSRPEVLEFLQNQTSDRTLIGMDMGISLPFIDADAFFPDWKDSPNDAKSLWALIDETCCDDPHLECASFLEHAQVSRYFRHSNIREGERFHLPDAASREGRFRQAELAQRNQGIRPVSNFNLVGAAQVGKSSLTGMRMLNRLRGAVSVWPIDPVPDIGPVLVEIYTAIATRSGGIAKGRTKIRDFAALNAALGQLGSPPVQVDGPGNGPIDDHSSDALVSAAWLRNVANVEKFWHPAGLTTHIAQTEGWTFGAV